MRISNFDLKLIFFVHLQISIPEIVSESKRKKVEILA